MCKKTSSWQHNFNMHTFHLILLISWYCPQTLEFIYCKVMISFSQCFPLLSQHTHYATDKVKLFETIQGTELRVQHQKQRTNKQKKLSVMGWWESYEICYCELNVIFVGRKIHESHLHFLKKKKKLDGNLTGK